MIFCANKFEIRNFFFKHSNKLFREEDGMTIAINMKNVTLWLKPFFEYKAFNVLEKNPLWVTQSTTMICTVRMEF